MPECPKLASCPFFNDKLLNMPAVAEMTKASYCRSGHFEKCARYLAAQGLGAECVPGNLFPDQIERVDSLIRSGKR